MPFQLDLALLRTEFAQSFDMVIEAVNRTLDRLLIAGVILIGSGRTIAIIEAC